MIRLQVYKVLLQLHHRRWSHVNDVHEVRWCRDLDVTPTLRSTPVNMLTLRLALLKTLHLPVVFSDRSERELPSGHFAAIGAARLQVDRHFDGILVVEHILEQHEYRRVVAQAH